MMMILVLLLAVAFAKENNNLHTLPTVDQAWRQWNVLYASHSLLKQPSYTNSTFAENRFEIFSKHYALVKMHNSKFDESYTMELNQFAAMHNSEFRKYYNGYNQEMKKTLPANPNVRPAYDGVSDLPDSVDWRTKNMVTKVKNQQQCGSCWTFSAVVALEAAMAKVTGNLVSLSEQDLVDCVKNQKLPGSSDTCCDGCNGGLMDYAFQYLMDNQNGEDETELAYPYTGADGRCKYSANKAYTDAAITGFTDVTAGDEDSLKEALANVGPVSVAVDANSSWQMYSSGVLKPLFCPGSRLDHGVAAVGYGTDGGKDYWIIKNSWGETWGEEGYVRLNRGANTCGVANAASYVTAKKKLELEN